MTAIPEIFIEMDGATDLLDADSVSIHDPDDIAIQVFGWEDLAVDVRQVVPITYTTGNKGHDITDRVADEGILTLAFDNSIHNHAGLAGYYSPDHVNRRTGFAQDAVIQIRVVWGGTTYYQWYGTITTIKPSSGTLGDRMTLVQAADYMHYLFETDFTNIDVQASKTDDELLTTLIASAPVAPLATDYDTGDDTYAYAFHDEISGTSRIVTVIQKLMMSGLGKFFIRGSTTTPETLTYVTRSQALTATTPVYEFADDDWSVDVIRDDSTRVRKITVETNPVDIDASDVVLWQLNNEITLTASESLTFKMYLRDPNGRASRVAALSMVPPVADTDYKFSSVSGSGNDLNASIAFVYSDGADAIDVTVTNNAASTGYLWFFEPRGKGIYLYEPTTTSELTGLTAGTNLNVNMPYQDSILVGKDIATLVKSWYAVPSSNVSAVKFIANRSDALMTAALVGQVGDYCTVQETQTGINSGFFINGIDKQIKSGGRLINVTWYLAPAQLLYAFILDVSALDVDKLGA